ncbi:MAG: SH3 domain-containing protein [Geminicoccaceae bacterium]|nr:MAG: SH3 domain-containing protein [Geminicoccaceae bacterium]
MRVVGALLAFGLLLTPAAAQGERRHALFDAAWAAWHAPDYAVAYRLLAELRELPYGKQPVVDYMLATSACRLAGVRDYGARLLDWMLYGYPLTAESRRRVAFERDQCREPVILPVSAQPGEIVEIRSAGMTGFGKTFYWATQETQPVASYPIRRVREMDRATFTERLVPLDEVEGARSLATSLAPRASHRVTDRFVLISHGIHDDATLEEMGQTLDAFVAHLIATYEVVPPPHFLRVELVPDGWAVGQLALERHGLDVSSATIGYAFVEDASVIGAVPTAAPGTVLHELFHLLVRSNFGDVPQWLDEGIASLYEVWARRGDVFVGRENWRRQVLETTWDARPDMGTLIRSEWFLFDDPAQAEALAELEPHEMLHDLPTGREQAAMMAMARYTALYLQERGQLVDVYRALRDRGLADLDGAAPDHAVALVEAVLGQPVAAVDADFVAWFRGAPRDLAPPRTTGGVLHLTTGNVNLRTGPGTGYTRLTTLAVGTRLAVIETIDGWSRLELEDGTRAYVSADFLRPVAP